MFIIILITSFIIFFKTINYAIYEIKINSNKGAGILIIFLALLVVILAPYATFIR